MKIRISKMNSSSHLHLILENISIILMAIFSFFHFLLPSTVSDIILLAISGIGVFKVLGNIREYKKVDFVELIWILFYMYIILTNFCSKTFGRSFKSIVIQVGLFVATMAFTRTRNNMGKKYTDMVIWMGIIHLLGVGLQLIIPQILYNWKLAFYSPEQLAGLFRNERAGAYTGFTPATGELAFIISIFLLIVASRLIYFEKNMKWAVLTLLGCIALLLTQKRGLLLGVILAMGIVFFIHYNYKEKNIFKIIPYLLLAMFFLFLAIILIPDVTRIFVKFSSGSLSGREAYYEEAIRLFLLRPLIGNGAATFSALSSVEGINTAHNEYLRTLCELGIIGLCIYIIALFCTLRKSLGNYKSILQQKECSVEKQALLGFALAVQIFFMVYAMSGNPLSTKYQLLVYFISIAVCKSVPDK